MIQEHFKLQDVDKIAIQMTALFRGDEILMGWTDGNIQRLPFLDPIRDAPPPQIVIAAQSEEEAIGPNGVSEVQVPVGILILWEDNRYVLDDTEPTIMSVVQYIKQILTDKGNYYLNIPPISKRIVRRLVGFESVAYGGEEVDGGTIRYLILAVRYIANISVRTRERVCYE